MAQWFNIFMAGNNDWLLSSEYGLNSPVVIWYSQNMWQWNSLPCSTQLWQLTLDGYIVSALNPNYVLGVGPNDQNNNPQAYLVTREPGNATQQWTVQSTGDPQNPWFGNIVNKSNGLCLTDSYPSSGAEVWLQAPPCPANCNQSWVITPYLPVNDQIFALQVGNTIGTKTPWVATIEGDSLAPGAQVIQYGAEPNSPNTLWKYTFDGNIVSMLDPQIALSLDGANNVVTYPLQPNYQPFQQWTFIPVDKKAGTYWILNQGNQLYLSIQLTDPANFTLTTAPAGDSPENQLWAVTPTYPLESILAQPQVPFPQFSGDEGSVYSYLCKSLKLADIRAQYMNLAAPLAAYQNSINFIALGGAENIGGTSVPSNIAKTVWQSVALQLNKELTAMQTVQAFFQQLTMLHTELSVVVTNALAKLIADAAVPQGVTITAQVSPVQILGGLVYTALSMASPMDDVLGKGLGIGLPIIANVLQTGINTAAAYRQSKAQDAATAQKQFELEKFSGEVSDLQQYLISSFESIGDGLAALETVILSDYAKSEIVAEMVTRATGGDSLYWPVDQTPMLVNRLLPGFEVAIMQALLPVTYQIYRDGWQQGNPPDNPPFYRYNEVLNTAIPPNSPSNATDIGPYYNSYWIAEQSNSGNYPTQAAIQQDVWNNGALPPLFFLRQGGWNNFSMKEKWLEENSSEGTKFSLLQFINYSSNALTVELKNGSEANFGSESGAGGPYGYLSLPPYGFQSMLLSQGGRDTPTASCIIWNGPVMVFQSSSIGDDTCDSPTWGGGYSNYPSSGPTLFTSSSDYNIGGCTIGLYLPWTMPT